MPTSRAAWMRDGKFGIFQEGIVGTKTVNQLAELAEQLDRRS